MKLKKSGNPPGPLLQRGNKTGKLTHWLVHASNKMFSFKLLGFEKY